MWNNKIAVKAHSMCLFYISEKNSIYLYTVDETAGFSVTGGLGSMEYLLTDGLFQSRKVQAQVLLIMPDLDVFHRNT